MAAKKIVPAKKPPVSGSSVPAAQAAIARKYPGVGNMRGVTTAAQAVQQLQGAVAESGLTDKFPKTTLMQAAKAVATKNFLDYQRGMNKTKKMK